MNEETIKRINELYKKSKAEGLNDSEREEQAILRRQYIDAMKQNMKSQLDNISIQEKDGSYTNLGDKFGTKEGH